MASSKKHSFVGKPITFYGGDELLRKIEQLAGSVKEPMEKALLAGAELPKRDMLKFIRQHRLTGVTESSFVAGKVEWINDNYLRFKLGFDIKQGGLPALFLDIGTPKIKPSFFTYYAIENNVSEIYAMQREALEKVVQQIMEK